MLVHQTPEESLNALLKKIEQDYRKETERLERNHKQIRRLAILGSLLLVASIICIFNTVLWATFLIASVLVQIYIHIKY